MTPVPTLLAGVLLLVSAATSTVAADEELDARVQAFLNSKAYQWHDMNVPPEDGQILYDIVVEHGFTRAVEIGTSTGHSTIWIAWALAKTGGKLVTIEIDRRRYEQAKENVAAAGLTDYVEFILGNAHEIVPALEGSYDFVFSDADKDWYINYFDAMYPKLTSDACFVAHNVRGRGGRGWRNPTGGYYDHVLQVEDMESHIDPRSRSGISISCKRR